MTHRVLGVFRANGPVFMLDWAWACHHCHHCNQGEGVRRKKESTDKKVTCSGRTVNRSQQRSDNLVIYARTNGLSRGPERPTAAPCNAVCAGGSRSSCTMSGQRHSGALGSESGREKQPLPQSFGQYSVHMISAVSCCAAAQRCRLFTSYWIW